MKLFSLHRSYFVAFVVVVLLLALSMYLQYYRGMVPCPLCIFQRISFAFLGMIFFLGAVTVFHTLYYKIIGGLAVIFSVMGAIFAGRQAWLQHLPMVNQSHCGASLQYMLQALPLHQVLTNVLMGSAECSAITWRFLSLSLAEWSFVCFALFALFSLIQCFNNNIGK